MSISGLDGSAGSIRTEENLTGLPASDFDAGNSTLEEADESTKSAICTAVAVAVGTLIGVGIDVAEAVGVAVRTTIAEVAVDSGL